MRFNLIKKLIQNNLINFQLHNYFFFYSSLFPDRNLNSHDFSPRHEWTQSTELVYFLHQFDGLITIIIARAIQTAPYELLNFLIFRNVDRNNFSFFSLDWRKAKSTCAVDSTSREKLSKNVCAWSREEKKRRGKTDKNNRRWVEQSLKLSGFMSAPFSLAFQRTFFSEIEEMFLRKNISDECDSIVDLSKAALNLSFHSF